MAVSCLRATAATFTLFVLLSVAFVSFEIDLDLHSWNFASRIGRPYFADAAPLKEKAVTHLTDAMDDVDLHADGKHHQDAEITEHQQKQVSQPHPEQAKTEPQSQLEPKVEVREEKPPVTEHAQQSHQNNDTQVPTQSGEEESQSEPPPNKDPPVAESDPKKDDDQTVEATVSSKRRKRAKTFLVVFMGHSGSTAFTTEIRSHPEFEVESLEPLEHGDYEFDTDKAIVLAREIMDRGIERGKIPGFKIRPFHVSNKPQLWQEFVKKYDTRIIWQYRENILKQAVGEYRNRVLNDSSVVEGLMLGEEPCKKGSGQICKFKIADFGKLHDLMNDGSTSDELLTSAVRVFRRENDMHVVRYEDYLYNREKTMRSTFDFLGVDFQNTQPGRQKASPDSLCDMVINFQDLCDRFVQCQLWRLYFTDDRNDCRCGPGRWQPFDPSFCYRKAWYQEKGNRK